jgi:hypothetical protein
MLASVIQIAKFAHHEAAKFGEFRDHHAIVPR